MDSFFEEKIAKSNTINHWVIQESFALSKYSLLKKTYYNLPIVTTHLSLTIRINHM